MTVFKDKTRGEEIGELKAEAEPEARRRKAKKIVIVVGAIVVAVVAVALAITQFIIPNKQARALQEAFGERVGIGDSVSFGRYEQDNDFGNGQEPILWRILAVEDGKVLLISDKILDCRQFNSSREKGNDWATSDLKSWLDGEFANSAFFSDEMEKIYEITCISFAESREYFKNDDDRACQPTEYAKTQGDLYVASDTGCSRWWFRTAGLYPYYASYSYSNGYVTLTGWDAGNTTNGVRPALWLNL